MMNFLLVFGLFSGFHLATNLSSMNLPPATQQVVLVETPSWQSPTGSLRKFCKLKGKWVSVGPAIPVTVGRTGLAWGDGLQSTVAGPEKSEGDLKSPAGIYKFGKAFGYADAPPPNTRLPYQKASAQDFYVSDPASTEYNQWVNLKSGVDPHTRWASFEKMRRSDSLYELGIVVEYNMSPVVKGKGSAIFFHIWRAADAPTAGCTAMEKQHLVELLQWLDPEKAPLLIQVPSTELRNIRYTGKH